MAAACRLPGVAEPAREAVQRSTCGATSRAASTPRTAAGSRACGSPTVARSRRSSTSPRRSRSTPPAAGCGARSAGATPSASRWSGGCAGAPRGGRSRRGPPTRAATGAGRAPGSRRVVPLSGRRGHERDAEAAIESAAGSRRVSSLPVDPPDHAARLRALERADQVAAALEAEPTFAGRLERLAAELAPCGIEAVDGEGQPIVAGEPPRDGLTLPLSAGGRGFGSLVLPAAPTARSRRRWSHAPPRRSTPPGCSSPSSARGCGRRCSRA